MENYYRLNNKWICKECQREFDSRQATTSHIYRTHTNPGVSFGGHQVGKPAWNKGLTGVHVPWNIGLPSSNKGKKLEDIVGEERAAIIKKNTSRRMSVKNNGGRSKWYEVAGQKCQGTWERNVALKFEELGIEWTKLKSIRIY